MTNDRMTKREAATAEFGAAASRLAMQTPRDEGKRDIRSFAILV